MENRCGAMTPCNLLRNGYSYTLRTTTSYFKYFFAFIIRIEKYIHTPVKMIHINSQNPTLVHIFLIILIYL